MKFNVQRLNWVTGTIDWESDVHFLMARGGARKVRRLLIDDDFGAFENDVINECSGLSMREQKGGTKEIEFVFGSQVRDLSNFMAGTASSNLIPALLNEAGMTSDFSELVRNSSELGLDGCRVRSISLLLPQWKISGLTVITDQAALAVQAIKQGMGIELTNVWDPVFGPLISGSNKSVSYVFHLGLMHHGLNSVDIRYSTKTPVIDASDPFNLLRVIETIRCPHDSTRSLIYKTHLGIAVTPKPMEIPSCSAAGTFGFILSPEGNQLVAEAVLHYDATFLASQINTISKHIEVA